jgi:multidrug/hemolysin transport system permease protein
MKTLGILIKRNTKMFFKDKGIFFTSLITPVILLVLYVAFLKNVYRDSILQTLSALAPETVVSGKTIDALVGGQLVSSLLAVCCVTVAFTSNMLSVQDKANSVAKDFFVAPVKRSTLACGYFISSYISSALVAFSALGLGLIYLSVVGWTLKITDVLALILDILLIVHQFFQ